jgi:hypothetical protein
LLLGTSTFTPAGREGWFNPAGMKPIDFLSYSAKQAALLDSGANLIPQLGGSVSKIPGKALFIHEPPLSRAVPPWHHFLSEVVPSKALEIEVVKPEKRNEVAPTLYVPMPMSFDDDPPALHPRRSYCC